MDTVCLEKERSIGGPDGVSKALIRSCHSPAQSPLRAPHCLQINPAFS